MEKIINKEKEYKQFLNDLGSYFNVKAKAMDDILKEKFIQKDKVREVINIIETNALQVGMTFQLGNAIIRLREELKLNE